MDNETIEVDSATAAKLRARAAERGMSVSELVADLTTLAVTPVELSHEEITALDRQWAAVKAGEPTVPHADVARWLRTWGTPAFKPWRER